MIRRGFIHNSYNNLHHKLTDVSKTNTCCLFIWFFKKHNKSRNDADLYEKVHQTWTQQSDTKKGLLFVNWFYEQSNTHVPSCSGTKKNFNNNCHSLNIINNHHHHHHHNGNVKNPRQ